MSYFLIVVSFLIVVPGIYSTQRSLQASSPFQDSKIDILYLKSEDTDNVPFRTAISDITGGTTDYWNGIVSVPTLDQISPYECVMVHYRGDFSDPEGLGDTLADYVDNGGVLVFSDGFTGGGFTDTRGVKGRIRGEGYSPIGTVGRALECGSSYSGDGTSLIYNGITTSFQSIENNRDSDQPLQGDGIADGTFDDGHIAAAHRPDFQVVYLGGTYCWESELDQGRCPEGDHIRRWVNACSIANTSFEPSSTPLDTNTPQPTPTAEVVTATPLDTDTPQPTQTAEVVTATPDENDGSASPPTPDSGERPQFEKSPKKKGKSPKKKGNKRGKKRKSKDSKKSRK
jgi:hypothetical protein